MSTRINRHSIMVWGVGRTLDGIPERVRTIVDYTEVKETTEAIRHRCMTVTIDMVEKLGEMSFGERFDSTVRGLMVVAHNVPVKIMVIGLYPYEQDILPPIATSLAYSPIKCHGCTPSVQILSQAMAIIARMIKEKISRRSGDNHSTEFVDHKELVSKFAMMLRCSYLCSMVGVAFVNCVPVPVDNMAKRVRCASIFSEWLGRMIEIHHSFGFKMSIVAMGAFAADSVRSTFSSYKGTNTKTNYVGLQNPAAISYLNINKYPSADPIQTTITEGELKVTASLGLSETTGLYTEYEWKTYPRDTLYQYMKEQAIANLTRALVDHTAEELLDPFITMSSSLFGNLGTAPTSYRPQAIQYDDDSRSVVDGNGGPVTSPTGPIFAQTNREQTENQTVNQSGTNTGHQAMGDRSFYVGKNSIFAQMNDSTGKSKSQQVIVLENIINKIETILESFRSREKTVTRMCEMMEAIMTKESIEDDDLTRLLVATKQRFPEELVKLEEATAVIAAMPALIEGDTGVIEGMTQPAAPLFRWSDRTTMKDSVFEQVMIDRSTGVAQARNPPQSIGVFQNSNQTTTTGMFANAGPSMMPRMSTAPSEVSTTAMDELMTRAEAMFQTAVEDHGTTDIIEALWWELSNDSSTVTTRTGTTMMSIVTKAIAIYIDTTEGTNPDDKALRNLIELMDPPTMENITGLVRTIQDLFGDRDGLVSFFDDDLMG